MKKIIGGRVYDTDTARELGVWTNTWDHRSWSYECETIYRKRTGEFFLHGQGGPRTKYAEPAGDNQWRGGETIIPLSLDKAREWAEGHLSADEYAEIFGVPEEVDGERSTLCIQIPEALMAKLRLAATEQRTSMTAIVADLLERM